MQLIVTHRAERSLDEIIQYYLKEHSPDRAMKILLTLEKIFARISAAPLSFPTNTDISHPRENIRHAIAHQTFKVIFRIFPDRIEVIEIFHSSRNPDLLKEIA